MLTKAQIEQEVIKAKHKLVSADNYKNLSSPIEIECSRGHIYSTTIEELRKSSVCAACSREIVSLNGYPPKKKGKRVVAIDQATNVAGLAVYDDGKLVYVAQRIFHGSTGERYAKFATFLIKEVINVWEVDHLVFEDIQLQSNVQTFKTLAGLLGVCTLIAELNNIPYSTFLNKVWQSTFNIKGSDRFAQKNNAIKKVEELFSIKVNNDIADAVLLGYHYLLNEGLKLF